MNYDFGMRNVVIALLFGIASIFFPWLVIAPQSAEGAAIMLKFVAIAGGLLLIISAGIALFQNVDEPSVTAVSNEHSKLEQSEDEELPTLETSVKQETSEQQQMRQKAAMLQDLGIKLAYVSAIVTFLATSILYFVD